MLPFILKRIVQGLAVMLVISLLSFSIQDNLGDPLREMLGEAVSEADRQAMRDKLGLNDPFHQRYGRFLAGAIQGDLGTSYFFKKPALEVILERMPATLELTFGATLIIVLLSFPLGVYTATHPHTLWTKLISILPN